MARDDWGVNVSAEQWAAIAHAIELPAIPRATSVSLVLRLGQRSAGWELYGQRGERPGPALDLTAATAVRLSARRFPQRPALIETETAGGFGSAVWPRVFGLFTVDGVVTDAADGEVAFALTPEHTNATGRYLFEPRVEFPGGVVLAPRLLKLTLLGGVSE